MFKSLLKNSYAKGAISRFIVGSSLSTGFIFAISANQSVQAKAKAIVAVEPLVCDLVSAIAPPSTPITCLIDRKQDVHDVKITPRQAQILRSANHVFTLGSEMTPAIKKWLDKPVTVDVGVSAIEIDDHSSSKHDAHDDHYDHSDSHGEGAFEFETDEHFFKDVAGDDVEPIAQVPDEGVHHHHEHGGLDPHIWHDPHNIIKMGNVISKNINKKISFFDRETKKF